MTRKSSFWVLWTRCLAVMYTIFAYRLYINQYLSQMITYTTQETVSHVLTQEGAQIALQGSHEARVFNACPVKGEGSPIPIKELQQKVGAETAKIGQGQAFKNKWQFSEARLGKSDALLHHEGGSQGWI